jgi:hypothetical protein
MGYAIADSLLIRIPRECHFNWIIFVSLIIHCDVLKY